MAKPEHFPRISDKLHLFIAITERGERSPQWLLEFIADGAREFMRGGKPWQNGSGGRPKARYGRDEIRCYILHHFGKLKPAEVASALGMLSSDGADIAATVRRTIRRGEIAYRMAETGQILMLKTMFGELLNIDLQDLPVNVRRKCFDGLKAGLASLICDDREPGFE